MKEYSTVDYYIIINNEAVIDCGISMTVKFNEMILNSRA